MYIMSVSHTHCRSKQLTMLAEVSQKEGLQLSEPEEQADGFLRGCEPIHANYVSYLHLPGCVPNGASGMKTLFGSKTPFKHYKSANSFLPVYQRDKPPHETLSKPTRHTQ